MTDDIVRRQSAVSQFFYDADAGTVMGRTGRSWAKILLFYTIYYSFLALLFFISIWTMQAISRPGELSQGAPTLSRVEQPGMTVYPHQDDREDKDGLEYPVCVGTDFGAFKETRYYKNLENFFNTYDDEKMQESVKNLKSPDVAKFNKADRQKYIEDLYNGNTIVAILSLNKVLNFEIKGRTSLNFDSAAYDSCPEENICEPPFQHKQLNKKDAFTMDSLYFNCMALDDKGEFTTKSNITIDLANTANDGGRINVADYTVNDQDFDASKIEKTPNHRLVNYIKPFVAFKINVPENTEDGTKIRFRCLPIAANINNSYESAETKKKFGKNGLGMIEFGYRFRIGADNCKQPL